MLAINRAMTVECNRWLYEKVVEVRFCGPTCLLSCVMHGYMSSPLGYTRSITYKTHSETEASAELRGLASLKALEKYRPSTNIVESGRMCGSDWIVDLKRVDDTDDWMKGLFGPRWQVSLMRKQ